MPNNNLPPQEGVEFRKGKDWGLLAPLAYDTPEFKEVFEDTMEISQLAKVNDEPWPDKVIELLRKYTPWELDADIPGTLSEFGFNSWREVVDHVKDDECVENFVSVAKWSKRNKVPKKPNRDFIKGDGYGAYGRLVDRGIRTMEKVFDQKYFNYYKYKTLRPLHLLAELLGCDPACMVHYNNPGHPEIPTGHGGKDGEVLDHARDIYAYNPQQDLKVVTFLSVRTHGRSGGPVHWLNSNLQSWALAGIKMAKDVFIRKDFKNS